MSEIQVIINYSDELGLIILVDGNEMKDIPSIQEESILDWFPPSNDRAGWRGLIEEIQRFAGDKDIPLSIEFHGSEEEKNNFKDKLAKLNVRYQENDPTREEDAKRILAVAQQVEGKGNYKVAFAEYLYVADYGKNDDAQYNVAEYYYSHYKGEDKGEAIRGNAPKEAVENAIDYYKKAAEAGKAEARWKLYDLLSSGEDVAKDWSEAIKWLTEIADSGDVEAQWKLYDLLSSGEDVAKDWSEAIKWLTKIADSGDAEAQCKMGNCYDTGIGVEQNDGKAFEWYEKSAKQGNVDAQFYLGSCYDAGIGVEQNDGKAFEWYKKSAKQGNVDAQFCLGRCYYFGKGVVQNYGKAFKWHVKSAKQGNVDAQFALGKCYRKRGGTRF